MTAITALKDFNTLEEANAYSVTKTEIFSASTMRIYLRSVGLYLYLKDLFEGKHDVYDVDGSWVSHHPAKEDVSMLFEALSSPNADGKDFNFIEFNADGVTPNVFGQGNIQALQTMIDETLTEKAAELIQLLAACKARSNIVYQPYADVIQADFDAVKFVPSEVEAEKTGAYAEGYIITTGNQGIDCEVTADKDCNVTVYLAVCNDSGSQDDTANFIRYEQAVGRTPVKNGKGILSLGSRKVRQYNKMYAIADNDAVITLVVKTNRG